MKRSIQGRTANTDTGSRERRSATMLQSLNSPNVSVFWSQSMEEEKIQVPYDYWFASDVERNFDYYSKRRWLSSHLYVPYVIAIVYLTTIHLGQRCMKSRPAFQLRRPLILWNVSLSIFSIVGALRTVPWFSTYVATFGLHASCCIEPNINGVFGFYVWAFIISKIPELGDTYFIIARKQKLIFLHWFHHVSVLFFVWYGNSQKISIGPWFVAMNYPIHALMYIHFSLRAMKAKVPAIMPIVITSLQVAQMLAGTTITLYAYSLTRESAQVMCDTHTTTINISLLLYGSYLMLFLNFFIVRYLSGFATRLVNKGSMDH